MAAALVALLCASAPLVAGAAMSAVISAVSPPTGGLAGGTYLTLKGVGWARAGMPGATRAYINGRECIQNQGVILDSTDTNFICWTPPFYGPGEVIDDSYNDREVLLKVVLTMTDGTSVEAAHACYTQRGDGSCRFTYKRDLTPVVFQASTGVLPGGILRVYGNLRHPDSFKYWVRTGGMIGGGGVEGALCFPAGPM